MTTFTPEQERKIKRLHDLSENGHLAVAQELFDLEKKIDDFNTRFSNFEQKATSSIEEATKNIPNIRDLLEQVKGKDGESIKGDKGDQGEDGDAPVPGIDFPFPKDGKDGRNGRDGKDGKDGKTPDINSIAMLAADITEKNIAPKIPKIEDIETNLPKLGEQIRNSLELLEGDNRLDASAIKGLKKIFDEFENIVNQRIVAVGMNRNNIQYYDLTDQCDGMKTTFNIPGNYKVLEVKSTEFPIVYRPLVDWTVSGTTLTLTSQVSAPQTGQTFYIIFIES